MVKSRRSDAVIARSNYGLRERLMSTTLMVGMGSVAGVNAATANAGSSVAASMPVHNSVGNHALTGWQSASHATANGVNTFAVSNVLHAASQPSVHSTSAHSNQPLWDSGATSSFITPTANQGQAGHDLNLSSATAMFAANTLAGFHTLTINVGGKQQVVNVSTQLTAAELVAAAQVLAGGKQQLTVNASGIASGGIFNLDKTTVTALDKALGGTIGSLTIGKGVEVVDSLATLSLGGTLNNSGSILVGAAPSAHGQTVDVISATNIYNAAGGIIQSGSILGTLVPTDITLQASTSFINSGIIHSSGNLNIAGASISNLAASSAKPTITAAANVSLDSSLINNTGTVTSTAGNVAVGGANVANLMVLNSNGVLQAQKGSIEFTVAGNKNNDTVTVSGGNLLSKVVDFEAGKGALQVNVGQLTGAVQGEACSAHVTANTKSLNLGNLDVTGDPTYYNTGGDIVVNDGFHATGGASLALVASGNIIGNGGTLDTSSSTQAGGGLTLIAGANFTVSPTASTGQTGPDSTSLVTVTNSSANTKGSKTGGYIDLSGITLTGSTTNAPVAAVTTSGTNGASGDVLMVAYKGSGKNSGNIVDTAVTSQTTGASSINADGGTARGDITIVAPGTITGEATVSNNLTILNGTPVLGGAGTTLTILNGVILPNSATYSLGGAQPLKGSITQATLSALENITISTAGTVNAQRFNSSTLNLTAAIAGTSSNPIRLNDIGTTAITVNSPSGVAKGAIFLNTEVSDISVTQVTLPSTTTFSLSSGGAIQIDGNINAGYISLTAGGAITNTGSNIITGNSVNLTTTQTGSAQVEVSATDFAIHSAGPSNQITLDANAAKTTTVLASTIGGNTLIVANQSLKIAGEIDLAASARLEVDYIPSTAPSKTAVGITLAAPINTPSALNGTIIFGNTNNKTATFVVSNGAVINAAQSQVDWAGPVGTSGAPVVVNTANNFSASSQSSIFIRDTGVGAISASSTSTSATAPSSVSISGAGSAVNIGTVAAQIVTITNSTSKGKPDGDINLVPMARISGFGTTGSITISTPGNISQDDTTAIISGNKITLTSAAGNIGSLLTAIKLSSSNPDNISLVSVNAAKGSAILASTADVTLAKGAALGTFQFTANSLKTSAVSANEVELFTSAGDLTVGGNLGGTKSTDVNLNTAGNLSATGKTILQAASIELTATNNIGQIGNGSIDSILTRATNLSVSSTNGFASVSNTGNLNLVAASGTGEISIRSTGTLTTSAATTGITTLTLSATAGITFLSGANIKANTINLTAPLVNLDTGSVVTAGSGARDGTNISSTTNLIVSGDGRLNAGTTIVLTGANIQIGTTVDLHDPINFSGSSTTGIFEAISKGNLSLDFSQPITLQTQQPGGTLGTSIVVSNIVNLNAAATTPLKITATNNDSLTSNSIAVTLSGTNAVNLGDAAGQIQLAAVGTGGVADGAVTFSTNGALSLAANPYLLTGGGAAINLSGKTVSLSQDLNSSLVSSLILTATGGTLDVNKSLIVAGTGSVTIAGSKGEIVEFGSSINANIVQFIGPALTNNGSVSGAGTQPTLAIFTANAKSAPLTISSTQTGQFTGFYGAVIAASGNGALNLGNLFTTTDLLKDNLTSLGIGNEATGKVTFSPLVQEVGVVQNGALSITGASVGFTSTAAAPALVLNVPGGNLTVNLNAPITVGTLKGNYDIQGTQFNLVLSALGNLTINEPIAATGGASVLDATNQVIVNAATNFHAMNGSGTVTVENDGTSKTSYVVNTAATAISGDRVTLQRSSTITAATPTYTNAGTVFLQGGALNVSNSFVGETHILGTPSASPLTSVLFANDSGSTTGQLTVEPITTTNGNMTLTEKSGNIVLAGLFAGSHTFNATNGNIVINDLNAAGTITIFGGDQVVASATKAGLGNVTIVVGAIPNPPVAGSAPANPPAQNETLGGQIFWGSGPLNFVGTNTVSALGRNVIFSSGSGAINVGTTLSGFTGGVLIQADPPVGASSLSNALLSSTTHQTMPSPDSAFAVNSATKFVQAIPTARDGTSAFLPFFNQAAFSLNAAVVEKGETTLPAAYKGDVFSGASLLAPDKDTVIETGAGKVSIAGGSVVLLLAFDGGVAVYNLHDTRASAVTVEHGTIKLAVSPGRSVVLTSKHVRFFEEINPIQAAAYRNVRSSKLSNGMTSFQADFSHTSLLSGVGSLRALLTAQDKSTRKAASSMLKTAAILSQTSGAGAGQYQYMVAPDMVAPAVTASSL